MDGLVMFIVYTIGFVFSYSFILASTGCEALAVIGGVIVGAIFTFFVMDIGGGDENKY